MKKTEIRKIDIPFNPRYVGTCTIWYGIIGATIQKTGLYKFIWVMFSQPLNFICPVWTGRIQFRPAYIFWLSQNSCSLVPFRQSHHPILTLSPSLWLQSGGCVATYLTPDTSPYCPISIQSLFFCAVGRKTWSKGTVNYKNDILINIILKILTNSEYG